MGPWAEAEGPLLLGVRLKGHRDLCWHLLRATCCLLLGALLGTVLYGCTQRMVRGGTGRALVGGVPSMSVFSWPFLTQSACRLGEPFGHQIETHLSFLGTLPTGHPSTPGKKLHWRSDVDASFIQGGFRLANDSLVVPASGTYIVYFQVAFLGASCPAGDEPLFLSHRVLLFSDAYPEDIPLLSAHKAACPGAAPWYHFLRQGAAFALQKGDRLSTQTEGKMHLLAGPGALSFGAFAL
uniref:Lymphotoxin-alpha n=1 Tax=Pelusios castaneus TaxID=367368 RepID=A0A8C8RNQ1_9SAUR